MPDDQILSLMLHCIVHCAQDLPGHSTVMPLNSAVKLEILGQELTSPARRRMNNELKVPPNFEGLDLGCIDADFIK